MSKADVLPKKSPYKRTDFRYEIWLKDRRALKAKAKRESFKVEAQLNASLPKKALDAVCVDTTKARSTLDVIRICLKELGWREYPYGRRDGEPCDIYWHSVHFNENQDIPGGKVNKFPGMIEVVRKVNLGRSLDIMHQMFPEEYNFHPRSWFLPQQFAEFCDAARRAMEKYENSSNSSSSSSKNRPIYIVKPDEGSQGDGIYLIQDPSDYNFSPDGRSHVVQEYLAKPLLLENLKFDFRVYVIVSSIEPLEVYICKEGLARFCTVAYQSPTNRNIHDAFMHLTNYSLNKRSATYLHTESDDDGSKRTMRRVFRKLALMRYDTGKIWIDIKDLVTKTVIAIMPELKVEMKSEVPPYKTGPSCFQILGFDIMLTEDGKPFLLEVNANPSLRIDYENEIAPGIAEYIFSPVDEEIKKPLVMDTLLLMAPRHKSSARYCRRTVTKAPDKPLTNAENKENQHTDAADVPNTVPGEDDDDYEVLPPHKGYGSLEQVYPAGMSEDYDDLRFLERTADIFLDCLGIRGHLRMGPTGFRNFTRKCKITGTGPGGFTNAAFDIMYIDLQRRWEHMNHDRAVGGLCYQGFVEAFFHISKKRYPTLSTRDAVFKLLESCERNLEAERDAKPQTLLPKISGARLKEETMRKAYGNPIRKRVVGQSFYIDYKNNPNSVNNTSGSARNVGGVRASAGCRSAPPRKKLESIASAGKQVRSTAKIGDVDVSTRTITTTTSDSKTDGVTEQEDTLQ